MATPGRLLDLLERKAASFAHVQVLVLDKADRMLDMGFWPSVRRIIAQLPKERQTLLAGRARNPERNALMAITWIALEWCQRILGRGPEVNEKQLQAFLKTAELGSMKAVFAERDPELVRELYQLAIGQIEGFCPKAAAVLEEAEADALAYLDFPYEHHVRLRTGNAPGRADR